MTLHGAADATLTSLDPVVDPGAVTIGVAIAVPEPWGSAIKAARERYGDTQGHAIPTHITLLAPAMVAPASLPAIDAHLREAAAAVAPFRVTLRGTATFRPVSPVVFIAVVEGISGCEALERRVRSGPLNRRRSFPYHPHVTLVHEVPDAVMDQAFAEHCQFSATFEATAFTRYEQDGAGMWQPVATYPLGQTVPLD